MVQYDAVAKVVRPKREAQAKAEAALEIVMKGELGRNTRMC